MSFWDLPLIISKMEIVILFWILIELGFVVYAVTEIRAAKKRAQVNEERINKFINQIGKIGFKTIVKKIMGGKNKG